MEGADSEPVVARDAVGEGVPTQGWETTPTPPAGRKPYSGAELRADLYALGLSVEELAQVLGVKPSRVKAWISGAIIRIPEDVAPRVEALLAEQETVITAMQEAIAKGLVVVLPRNSQGRAGRWLLAAAAKIRRENRDARFVWSPPLSRRAVRLERILHAAGITQVPQPMTFPLAPGRPLPRQLHPAILTYTIPNDNDDDDGSVTGEAQLLFARPGDGFYGPEETWEAWLERNIDSLPEGAEPTRIHHPTPPAD